MCPLPLLAKVVGRGFFYSGFSGSNDAFCATGVSRAHPAKNQCNQVDWRRSL